MRSIKICGVDYIIEETEDKFTANANHFGEIDYAKTKIFINKDMSDGSKAETLCHEIVHGILFHTGMYEANKDEQFVQAMGNAIYQTFTPKIEEYNDDSIEKERKSR